MKPYTTCVCILTGALHTLYEWATRVTTFQVTSETWRAAIPGKWCSHLHQAIKPGLYNEWNIGSKKHICWKAALYREPIKPGSEWRHQWPNYDSRYGESAGHLCWPDCNWADKCSIAIVPLAVGGALAFIIWADGLGPLQSHFRGNLGNWYRDSSRNVWLCMAVFCMVAVYFDTAFMDCTQVQSNTWQ